MRPSERWRVSRRAGAGPYGGVGAAGARHPLWAWAWPSRPSVGRVGGAFGRVCQWGTALLACVGLGGPLKRGVGCWRGGSCRGGVWLATMVGCVLLGNGIPRRRGPGPRRLARTAEARRGELSFTAGAGGLRPARSSPRPGSAHAAPGLHGGRQRPARPSLRSGSARPGARPSWSASASCAAVSTTGERDGRCSAIMVGAGGLRGRPHDGECAAWRRAFTAGGSGLHVPFLRSGIVRPRAWPS